MRTGLLVSKKCLGARIVCFQKKNQLIIYKRHQIVIAELEIGAVGIVFSRRIMVGTRQPGKGQNMEINEKHARFGNVYTCKKSPNMDKNHRFLGETVS
jgi:hypothetical protein